MTAAVLSFEGALVVPAAQRGVVLERVLHRHALLDAVAPRASWQALVEGRTFDEAVQRACAHEARAQADPARLTVAALDAESRYAEWLRDGASVAGEVEAQLDAWADQGQRRLVLRADSPRRQVEPFLLRWALHDRFAMIRCADDPPVPAGAGRGSYHRSWDAIAQRLQRWGVAPAECLLLGHTGAAEMVARQRLTGAAAPAGEY